MALPPPQNQFAIVLDGLVISAPDQRGDHHGKAQITGNFTATSARELANQLKYGALPLSFTMQRQKEISPTLGKEQLRGACSPA